MTNKQSPATGGSTVNPQANGGTGGATTGAETKDDLVKLPKAGKEGAPGLLEIAQSLGIQADMSWNKPRLADAILEARAAKG